VLHGGTSVDDGRAEADAAWQREQDKGAPRQDAAQHVEEAALDGVALGREVHGDRP